MPISYADDISDGHSVNIFLKLLVRWKGSLYKLLWLDLLVFLIGYFFLNLTYRLFLTEEQKRTFELVVKFCDSMKANIPISFLLGFFVAGIIGRWWTMYLTIPRLNRIAFLIDGYVIGNGPMMSQKLRITLTRYMNLAWILLMRGISAQIAERFRMNNEEDTEEFSLRDMFLNFNRDRKIQATYRKIITDAEIRAFENIAAKNFAMRKSRYLPEYWIPMQWASRLLQKAYMHGFIGDQRTMNSLIDEMDILRGQMQSLQIYSSIMIPLVYTQVVIIAVYSYFLCQLFSSQCVDPKQKLEGHEIDMYVPIFHIFQFLFIMGWLKVAMCVMNPFIGNEDEDFQTSMILDYNLDVSYRCAQADNGMYPDNLDPPDFLYRKQDGYEHDALYKFVDNIDDDLEETDVPSGQDNLTALELRSSDFAGFKKYFTCCTVKTSLLPLSDRRRFSLKEEVESHQVQEMAERNPFCFNDSAYFSDRPSIYSSGSNSHATPIRL